MLELAYLNAAFETGIENPLDAAIVAAVATFCRNSGQICSAGTRLFVHESLHDEITARVVGAQR